MNLFRNEDYSIEVFIFFRILYFHTFKIYLLMSYNWFLITPEPGLKSIFVARLCVVLNFCILINNELTLVQKFKTL
jgi:hypothetical protein